MQDTAASALGAPALGAALEALPDGIVFLNPQWTICYINPAGAALAGRPAAELTGRSVWAAIPELAGSIFDTFLRHAHAAGTPVTWSGFWTPTGRWLTATAVTVGDLLLVCFQDTIAAPVDGVGHPPSDAVTASPPHAADGAERAAAADRAAADRDRLRFLAEVSEAMITTLDTGASAAQLARLAVSRLCDWAVVSLIGEDGDAGEEAWAHRDPARRADLDTYMRGRRPGTGDDVALVDALRSGQPVQVNPIREALVAPSLPTDQVRAAWRRLQSATTTIVPLRARGQTFGALALVNSAARPPHTEDEIATAVEVARRGALALDNARLYGRQLKVAATLQHSLLTPPPQPDGLQIEVRYRPAAAHQQVGGDWYDGFVQPDGATTLVIGDVVGHNIQAAAAMGQLRSILRGLACDRPGHPAQILTRVDRVLATLGVPTLATALVARIEPAPERDGGGQHTLRWSSAGHLPPLLCHPGGAVRQLTTAPERLLGAGYPRPRTDHELTLRAGDTVVFVTDGLVEHGRTGIDDGLARLTRVLADLAELPLAQLCDGLLDRIVTGRADDDIAILAVRRQTDTDRPG